MIREITRKQIEAKTAQGERVALIEVASDGSASYERQHIPGAVLMEAERTAELAPRYFPDRVVELVVYGAGGHDPAGGLADQVAGRLASLGYGNLYVYRGGKADWFGSGSFAESTHRPPATGERARFDEPDAGWLGRLFTASGDSAAPAALALQLAYRYGLRRIGKGALFRSSFALLAAYGAVRGARYLLNEHQRKRGEAA